MHVSRAADRRACRLVRVLLADDHAAVRRALRRLLDSEPDVEVYGEAEDGEAAVSLAAAMRPDVVVLDFAMPRLDGIEAARRIRAMRPGVRIVIVTAHAVSTVLTAAAAAGVDAVLDKAELAERLLPVVLALAPAGQGTTRPCDPSSGFSLAGPRVSPDRR